MKTTRQSRKPVAAVLCLAVVGLLYAINSSHPKATNAVEAKFVCDSGKASPHNHAAHTSESIGDGDSIGVIEPPVIDTVNAPAPAPEGMVCIPGGGRGKGEPDTGTNHLGFFCVRSPK